MTQWLLYVPHSGHYTYRTMVTIRTAKWSLYVQHNGYYTYRKVVTIHTVQWLLNVPPGVTFNNATFCPRSVYMCLVWMSEQTAIIFLYSINWLVFITETECVYCAVRTGSLYIIPRSAHTVYLCVLCGSENKQRLFPYTTLTDWFL